MSLLLSERPKLNSKAYTAFVLVTFTFFSACSIEHKHSVETGPRMTDILKDLKEGAIASKEAVKNISSAIKEQFTTQNSSSESNKALQVESLISNNTRADLEEVIIFSETENENLFDVIFDSQETAIFNVEELKLTFATMNYELAVDDSSEYYISWWFVSDEFSTVHLELMPDPDNSARIYGLFSFFTN